MWNEQYSCTVAKTGYYEVTALKYLKMVKYIIPTYANKRAESNLNQHCDQRKMHTIYNFLVQLMFSAYCMIGVLETLWFSGKNYTFPRKYNNKRYFLLDTPSIDTIYIYTHMLWFHFTNLTIIRLSSFCHRYFG